MDKSPAAITSMSRSESPLDGICLSESEKTAVLTLIREEVTARDPILPGCTPARRPPRGAAPRRTPDGCCCGEERGQLCSAQGGSGPLRITGTGQQGRPPRARPKGPVSAAT